eukprot:5987664-Pyramimonas_sp.AAC.1
MTEEYTCVQLATIRVHEVVLMSDVVIPAGQPLVIYKQRLPPEGARGRRARRSEADKQDEEDEQGENQ